MRTTHHILAASAAVLLLATTSVPAALGAAKAPTAKLTKTTAATAARKDAEAAATISTGDKVVVSDCRAYGRSAFKCAIQLIPASSASRCHWTDTIRLVKGKPSITYSGASCSG